MRVRRRLVPCYCNSQPSSVEDLLALLHLVTMLSTDIVQSVI